MNYVVAMASCREFPLEKYEPLLAKTNVHFAIVDDSGGLAERPSHPAVTWINAELEEKLLGKHARYLVHHRSASCKNAALYYAWKAGADVVIILDDDLDLRPYPNFLEEVPIGRTVPARTFQSASGWFNPMAILSYGHGLYARGFPVEYRGEKISLGPVVWTTPEFNEGLWSGLPDIDAATKLYLKPIDLKAERVVTNRVVVGVGQKLPLSIMNVQIARRWLPAFYQPRNYHLDQFVVARHDDLWAMAFLKRLMDDMGATVTVGPPIVWHDREGNDLRDTFYEIGMMAVTPALYDALMVSYSPGHSIACSARHLADAALRYARRFPGSLGNILADHFSRASWWARLFQEEPCQSTHSTAQKEIGKTTCCDLSAATLSQSSALNAEQDVDSD